MKKKVDWINSHKIITVCIAFLLLVTQPFFVHLFLKIPAPSPFLVRKWDAGDLITYIAGFEAFIGTVFLGVVAVRQNDMANDINQKLLDNEKKRSIFERLPEIKITAGDPSIQTLATLYECEYPFYYHIGALPTSRDCSTRLSHQLWLFTIYITPIKNYNLHLSSFDLNLRYLTVLDVVESIKFENKPDPYASYSHYIRDGSYAIYFILDKKIINENRNINGTMTLLLRNGAADKFSLIIPFKLSVVNINAANEATNISITIKDSNVDPVFD